MNSSPNNFAEFETGLPPCSLRSKLLANREMNKLRQFGSTATIESILTTSDVPAYLRRRYIPLFMSSYVENLGPYNVKNNEKPNFYRILLYVQLKK